MNTEIQEILNRYCLIVRKYNLLNEDQFFSEFSNIKTEYLENAWKYSFEKIQNREIVKNTGYFGLCMPPISVSWVPLKKTLQS